MPTSLPLRGCDSDWNGFGLEEDSEIETGEPLVYVGIEILEDQRVPAGSLQIMPACFQPRPWHQILSPLEKVVIAVLCAITLFVLGFAAGQHYGGPPEPEFSHEQSEP